MVSIKVVRDAKKKPSKALVLAPRKPSSKTMSLSIQPPMPLTRYSRPTRPLNSELAAYAAAQIDPLAPVLARVPDNNNSSTVACQVITTYTATALNGYLNISFNPKSLDKQYDVQNAADFKTPSVAATNNASYKACFAGMRVVSAGVYVLPNVTLSERVGRSYCVHLPRGATMPTSTEMMVMQDAGPHDLRDGCFMRYSKSDHEDDQFLASDNTNTDGPFILVRVADASTTAQYTIKFVTNYEATVKPVYQNIIRASPSPRYPEERARIDSKVSELPADTTAKQMATGGPTPASASISGALVGIANGVESVTNAVLGKGNIVGKAAGWIGSAVGKIGSWLGL